MKLLVLAVCVAVASAFTPAQRPTCNIINVRGGTLMMPHEKYCQLAYACSILGNQEIIACPGKLLFAYGIGTSVCATGAQQYACPNWQCATAQDVGKRYPDVCCGSYWQCDSVGQYVQKQCNAGTTFNFVTEQCEVNSGCINDAKCVSSVVNSGISTCNLFQSQSGDPCKYRSRDFEGDRNCAPGTAFSQADCGCTQFRDQCGNNGITYQESQQNKLVDAQCRASGRMEFLATGMRVQSDKLNKAIDHYTETEGVTYSNGEAIFSTLNNAQARLYDFYYNDNRLKAPVAIVMTFRIDAINPTIQDRYTLLENRYTADSNNAHCLPTTLEVTAQYQGITGGVNQNWQFAVKAIGENGQTGTASGVISGVTGDYYRMVFRYGGGAVEASVQNRGFGNTNVNGQVLNLVSNQVQLGGFIRPNKCGFTIGRNFNGRLREFTVYEGCGNFQNLN